MTSSAKLSSAQASRQSLRKRSDRDRRRIRRLLFESLEERQVLSSFPAPVESWQQADFINNEVIVRFRSDANPAQTQALLVSLGAIVVTKWDELNMSHIRFAIPRGRDETIAAAKILHENANVEYAEPNFLMYPDVVPNDPLFVDQWGLNNVGQVSPFPPFFAGIFDADIDAPEAWDTETGGPNTVVAIIDTGTDYTHPDLAPNIWRNPGEIADGIDNDNNGFVDDIIGYDTFANDNDPMDEHGHGTHVAGIVGAVGNNGIGVSGVSWNSKLMIIKASAPSGAFSTAGIVGAQVYISRMKLQHGVNVVASNNSYGGLGPALFSFAQYDAIRVANQAGIAFIAAAGNNGVNIDNPTTPFFPAGYNLPGIISVAATDRDDFIAGFSNRGFASVDLGAPGVDILSTFSTTLPPLAPPPPAPNVPPPGYGWLDGTSMASPMVAGAYGIIKAFDPQLTIAQVKNLLLQSVDVLPTLSNVSVSGGRLNLKRALDNLPRNEFRGKVFADLDGDGRFDTGEPGQSGWTVYADLNNNRQLDGTEPSTTSGVGGVYNLGARLAPGDYFIREVVQTGWTQTLPNAAAGFAYKVTVQSGTDVFNNLDFGNKPSPGSVAGVKYNDLNGNGQRDSGEPGIQGIVIYVDLNNDQKIGIGEPGSITDATGRFQINNILPGVHIVREVAQAGFVQTEPDPTGANQGGISVTVIGGTVTQGLLFGNRVAVDWGDAPNSYGTLKTSNGPSHGLLTGFFLGDASDTSVAHVDAETNGIPSADADGDDLDNIDDEDGVSFLTDVVPGQNATIRVDVSSGSYGSGLLQGWIDFNDDGDFLDAGEQIIKDKNLATGSHLITFLVPATATVSDTYARFRWGLERGIGPMGPAKAGEVEDYTTSARAVAPTANDDAFTAARDSNFIDNPLDVMANDFPGVNGLPFELFQVPGTSVAGGLIITDDNGTPGDATDDFLRYKPPTGFIGKDSFQYRVWDGTNISKPGTVTITVVPLDPIGVDDTFDIAVGSSNVSLDVVANDIQGPAGALSVVSVSGTTAGGSASVNFATNKVIYTPPSPSFSGADTFTYVIQDSSGKTSFARVLVQVGGPAPNQIVQIEYSVFDSNGNQLLNNAPVQIGQTLELRAFTRDLRGSFPDPIFPLQFPDASGVLEAYADVLYNSTLAHPVPAPNIFGIDIAFGPLYPVAHSATASIPGIVDEAGAFIDQNTEYFLGSGDNLLFRIKFTTDQQGALKFVPNPEEDSPNFVFETTVHSQTTGQPIVLNNNQIFFKSSPTIQVVGAGEAEGTNYLNPLDVNVDGQVSPIDALLVISHLNRFGAGPFTPALAAASGQGVPEFFLDVNVDNFVTAMDAKLVIDYLNQKAAAPKTSSVTTSGVQAEGEGDSTSTALLVSGSSSSAPSGSSSSSSTSVTKSADPTTYASNVDRALSDIGFVAKPSSASTTISEDDDKESAEEEDSFFAELAAS